MRRSKPDITSDYFQTLRYRASTGAQIELSYEQPNKGRYQWAFRFTDSELWFGGFKDKLGAVFGASRKLRMSAKRLNWSPITES